MLSYTMVLLAFDQMYSCVYVFMPLHYSFPVSLLLALIIWSLKVSVFISAVLDSQKLVRGQICENTSSWVITYH